MAEDEAPHDPILSAVGVLRAPLADFFERHNEVSALKLSESPMAVSVVPVLVVVLSLPANVHCVAVKLKHVEQECQVIVCVWMTWLKSDNLLKILLGRFVVLELKVTKSQVIVHLWVAFIQYLRFQIKLLRLFVLMAFEK